MPRIAVIGGGPAGLMAAEVAAKGGATVTVYERMPSPGRKLLLAGRGGLNLTHSEAMPQFLARYGTAAARLEPILARFGPQDLKAWCTGLGIDTFVGTSGRVFPVSFKTSPLLRAWLRRLDAGGVGFRLRHCWRGWDKQGRLRFETPQGEATIEANATILALGGASWPHLGGDGSWFSSFHEIGVTPKHLKPANCGFMTDWSDTFRERFEGQPLKAVALSFADGTVRGDIVVTRTGLEGSPLYALAPHLRDAIAASGEVVVEIALRPDVPATAIVDRLERRRPKDSISNVLRRALNLTPAAIGLLREARLPDGATLSTLDAPSLARLVNAVPIRLTTPMPLARAISTAGGVRFEDIDEALMLRARPGTFVAGEMLDWEAPTGGYLLQGCFATGVVAAEGALVWLTRDTSGMWAQETLF